MNDIPPLTVDQVDELLSAELDDEFDAAARDLGLDPADARVRLEATTGVEARRRAMASARDTLAEVPPIDELVAARLRAKASRAAASEIRARAPRWQRLSAAAGALAAAVAVVFGIVAVTHRSEPRKSVSVASPPRLEPRRTGGEGGSTSQSSGQLADVDFGVAADARTLAERVRAAVAQNRAAGPGTPAPARPQTGYDTAETPARCDAAAHQLAGVPAPTPPLVRGHGLIGNSPVSVAVFEKGEDQIVVVLTTDCRLLGQQVAPAARK